MIAQAHKEKTKLYYQAHKEKRKQYNRNAQLKRLAKKYNLEKPTEKVERFVAETKKIKRKPRITQEQKDAIIALHLTGKN
jgi:uncharacterized protein YaiL (DUF2058 family)